MTRHVDPRFGENSYKLININRSEPARELFEVPAGYTVKEPPTPGGGYNGRGYRNRSWKRGRVICRPITGGVLNGKAISLPLPVYPADRQAGPGVWQCHRSNHH